MDPTRDQATTIARSMNDEMTKTISPSSSPNIYSTVDEYADRLSVSRGTVFGWIRIGMPSFRIGRTRRIVTDRADRWLEAGGADRSRTSTRTKRRTSRGRDWANGNNAGRQ